MPIEKGIGLFDGIIGIISHIQLGKKFTGKKVHEK
jgi:hypothetical protein